MGIPCTKQQRVTDFYHLSMGMQEGNVSYYVSVRGSHVTIAYDALDLTIQAHPLDMVPHWRGRSPCYWQLVAITGDLFKLVHFRPPQVLALAIESYVWCNWVVCILLECFLVRSTVTQSVFGIMHLKFILSESQHYTAWPPYHTCDAIRPCKNTKVLSY